MTDNQAPEAPQVPDWTPDNPLRYTNESWLPAAAEPIVEQASPTAQTQSKWVIPASIAAGFLLAGTLGGVGAAVVSASTHDQGLQGASVLSGQVQPGASVPGVPGGSLPQGDDADQESSQG